MLWCIPFLRCGKRPKSTVDRKQVTPYYTTRDKLRTVSEVLNGAVLYSRNIGPTDNTILMIRNGVVNSMQSALLLVCVEYFGKIASRTSCVQNSRRYAFFLFKARITNLAELYSVD